jgi:hypothetical protein
MDPNAQGGDQPDPDAGKDLTYLVPNAQVAWSTPPSFNLDPPNPNPPPSSGDPSGGDTPPCGTIQVNLPTLRSAEDSMLGAARIAVGDYQSLRDKVMSVKDTAFGQQSTVTSDGWWNPASQGWMAGGQASPSPVQDPAKKFADSINPGQEKVLWQIANALEIVGQYISAVNRSGQAYGQADRNAEFPAPPPNSAVST